MPILTLDARKYEEDEKNRIIAEAFDSLDLGERMVLINDYDPSSILNKMEKEREGKLEWESILNGPKQWEATLSKRYLNFI